MLVVMFRAEVQFKKVNSNTLPETLQTVSAHFLWIMVNVYCFTDGCSFRHIDIQPLFSLELLRKT